MGAKLVVSEQGRDELQVIDMRADEVWLGRGPECTLRVDDSQVSRRHAVIRRSQDRYLIEDLLSANGTYLNEQRVRGCQPLSPDDVVRCGGVVLRLVFDERPAHENPTQQLQVAPPANPWA
jgi:adenylate cyclase